MSRFLIKNPNFFRFNEVFQIRFFPTMKMCLGPRSTTSGSFGHFGALFIEYHQKQTLFNNFDTFFSLFIVPSDWTYVNKISFGKPNASNESIYFNDVMSKSKVENRVEKVSRGHLQKQRYRFINKKFTELIFCINNIDWKQNMMVTIVS